MRNISNNLYSLSRKPFALLTVLLSVFLISACLEDSNNGSESSFNSERQASVIIKNAKDQRDYQHFQLDNGLQVVLVSDPNITNMSASLSVGVGSFHNPASQPGLAHYLEHMLFLGTEKYPEPNGFQKFIAANAGSSNAYTTDDHTNYFFQVDVNKADQALDQFSDYFKSPTFDIEYSDKERNAVNSEWSTGKAQDYRILYRLGFLTANPEHPGQLISVGNLDTLKDKPGSILHQELQDFYQKYYSANIMKLVLVANLSFDEMQQLAQKHFSSIPNHKVERPHVNVAGLLPDNIGKNIYYSPIKPNKHIIIEFPIKNYQSDWQDKSYGYIQNILSSEEPGTAGEALRANGLINALYTQVTPDYYGVDGVFRVRIDLTDKGLASVTKVMQTVFSYIKLIEEKGVKELYFTEYQSMLNRRFINVEPPAATSLAVSLSQKMFDYPVQNLLNHRYIYSDFKPEKITKILQSFTPDNARIWHIYEQDNLPQKIPYYSGSYRIETISENDRQSLLAADSDMALQLPPLNTLFLEGPTEVVESRLLQPTLIASDSLHEVWLSHPQHIKSDKGLFLAQVNTDSASSNIINKLSSDIIFEVLKDRLTSLSDRASRAQLGVDLRMTGSSNITFQLSGPTQKHAELARQLKKEFSTLSITPENFVIAQSKVERSLLSVRKNEPYQQLFSQFSHIVRQVSWPEKEQLKALETISQKQVQAYLDDLKNSHILRVYAFGNYTEKTANEIAKTLLLKTQKQNLNVHKRSYRAPVKSAEISHTEQLEETDNAILKGYFFPEKNGKYEAALTLLNGFLRTEFYTQLRTNEQVGYIVGSSPTSCLLYTSPSPRDRG